MTKNAVFLSEQASHGDANAGIVLHANEQQQHLESYHDNSISGGLLVDDVSVERAPYPIDWSGNW